MADRPESSGALCCGCREADETRWNSLVGPVTVLKLGLQNLQARWDAGDTELDLSSEFDACMGALADLEAAHMEMQERLSTSQRCGKKCVDLTSFMRQVQFRWRNQARRSGCSITPNESRQLPKIEIERKCFWCFFDRFFSICLYSGACSSPWKIALLGRTEKGLAEIHIMAYHPGNATVLRETLDKLEKSRPPVCRNPLVVEYDRDACKERIVCKCCPIKPERLLTEECE